MRTTPDQRGIGAIQAQALDQRGLIGSQAQGAPVKAQGFAGPVQIEKHAARAVENLEIGAIFFYQLRQPPFPFLLVPGQDGQPGRLQPFRDARGILFRPQVPGGAEIAAADKILGLSPGAQGAKNGLFLPDPPRPFGKQRNRQGPAPLPGPCPIRRMPGRARCGLRAPAARERRRASLSAASAAARSPRARLIFRRRCQRCCACRGSSSRGAIFSSQSRLSS